ncbi:MAG: methyltransferase domain-containing protein [Lewinella sp.]|nr:methyltransferase domain-containing protein [Lewinella sp.]
MKDNFSSQSDQYARYRPTYPAAYFDYLDTLVPNKQTAWDCGTGNGQVAVQLARTFDRVFATDISQAQIDQARPADHITYSVQPAEATDFPDLFFDLIIAAQAIHWFDFDRFYAEVRRTAKEEALLCVVGYARPTITDAVDQVVTEFYTQVVGPYWDPERRYIDDHYQTIPFPFEEIEPPAFAHELSWSLEHLIGYLNTWSAVKHFIRANGYNPVDALRARLEAQWGEAPLRPVRFPLLLRLGYVS